MPGKVKAIHNPPVGTSPTLHLSCLEFAGRNNMGARRLPYAESLIRAAALGVHDAT